VVHQWKQPLTKYSQILKKKWKRIRNRPPLLFCLSLPFNHFVSFFLLWMNEWIYMLLMLFHTTLYYRSLLSHSVINKHLFNTTQKQNNKKHQTPTSCINLVQVYQIHSQPHFLHLLPFSLIYITIYNPHLIFFIKASIFLLFYQLGHLITKFIITKKRFNFLNVLFGLIPCVDTL
jgi:hypothetical protein